MLRLIMLILGRREWQWFFRGAVPTSRVGFTAVGIISCMAWVLANVLGYPYW